MFQAEQQAVESKIRAYCGQLRLREPEKIQWSPIPFSGEWGISTSFFQMAASEARYVKEQTGQKLDVPRRAQEIAEGMAEFLGDQPGFIRIEAVKGYLNLYFSSSNFSRHVVDTVLAEGSNFGRGFPTSERVMVEFSQPNTHKAFHVGHLRSAILGDAIARILNFSGYEVVRANYPGDMGLHVIIWLWNYIKNHAGEHPTEDTTQWMGDLYSEARHRLDDNPEMEAEVRALQEAVDEL